MKPHKHAELIKAWADGAEIQFFEHNKWNDKKHDCWYTHYEYRIKPEPKPDARRFLNQLRNRCNGYVCWEESEYQVTNNAIAITFDGETGELKSAEVLK